MMTTQTVISEDELRVAAAKLLEERPYISRNRFARLLHTTLHRLKRLGIPMPQPMHPKVIAKVRKKGWNLDNFRLSGKS